MRKTRIIIGNDARLPEPISRTINQLVLRIRKLLLVRGLLVVAAVGVVTLLATMAIDAVASPPRLLRGLMTLAGLGIFGTAAFRFLLRPLSRTFSAAGVARMVEEHHPEFHERLSSAVELLASSDDASVRGSQELIDELVKAASLDVKGVRPEHEFNLRTLARYVLAAGIAFALLVALFAVWPRQVQRLIVRNIVPFSQVGNLEALNLEVDPGDADWPEGESLTVNAVIEGAADEMNMQVPGLRGEETVVPMQPLPARPGETRFTYTFPKVSSRLQYRVICRDAVSRLFTVTPRVRPALDRLDLRYDLPAYTAASPAEIPDATGDITALVGTEVTLQGALNKPVRTARFLVNETETGEVRIDPNGKTCTWTFPVPPGTGNTWRVELEDNWGIANRREVFQLRAEPDSAPSVRVVQPAESRIAVKPNDRVMIRYSARDDYGLSAVALAAQIKGGAMVEMPVPTPQPDEDGRWTGEALLDLSRAELRAAREIDIHVRVTDGLPGESGGPNVANSAPVKLVIDARAADFIHYRVEQIKKMIHAGIDGIVAILGRAQTPLKDMHVHARVAGSLPEDIQKRLGQFGTAAQEGRAATENLAVQLLETDFASVADTLTGIAGDPVDAAIGFARLVELQDDANARSECARSAFDETGRAVRELLALKDTVTALAARLRLALQLREIAEKESQLAIEAAALERDAAIEEEWRRQQEQILNELEGLRAQADDFDDSEDTGELQREAGDMAEDVNRLAFEQDLLAQLAEEASEVYGVDAVSKARLREAVLDLLESRQRNLARRTRKLAAGMEVSRLPQAASVREAAQAGAKAAEELAAKRPAEAVKHADSSGETLSGAAGEKEAEHEVRTAELAAEQVEIADLIRAAQEEDLEKVVGDMQDSIQSRIEEQARRAEELREKAAEAERNKAKNAMDNLQAAADQAEQAKSELEKEPLGGQRRPNPNSMGGAGDKGGMAPEPLPGNRSGPKMNEKPTHTRPMETEGTPEPSELSSPSAAQQAMEDAAESLRQADDALKELSGMTELLEQLEAAQQQAENAADAAGIEEAEGAAEDAAAAALQASSRLGGAPPRGGTRNKSPLRRGAWRVSARLQELGISADDWVRLPGMLQDHLLAEGRDKTPEEYRVLVQRYLREVARLGSGGSD